MSYGKSHYFDWAIFHSKLFWHNQRVKSHLSHDPSPRCSWASANWRIQQTRPQGKRRAGTSARRTWATWWCIGRTWRTSRCFCTMAMAIDHLRGGFRSIRKWWFHFRKWRNHHDKWPGTGGFWMIQATEMLVCLGNMNEYDGMRCNEMQWGAIGCKW